MVILPFHEPMTPVERVMADRLAAELKVLLYGRTIAEALVLVMTINDALSRTEAEAKPPSVH